MKLCEGGKVATHETIVHEEKACPVCVLKDRLFATETKLADAERQITAMEESRDE